MKLIAKDFKEYWAAPWPKDAYVDDDAYKVNGEERSGSDFDPMKLDDADQVEILCGSVIDGEKGKDLRRVVRDWLKARDSVTIVVTVPRSREAEARAALEQFAQGVTPK